MISRNEENQTYTLTNEKMEAGFSFGTGFQLSHFVHKLMDQNRKNLEYQENRESQAAPG